MRTIHQWLELYGESHQHPTNKLIHWVCVPAIMFSIIGLCWSGSPVVTVCIMITSLLFYLRLSIPLTIAMVVIYGLLTVVAHSLNDQLIPVSLALFIVAWIFQLIGHHIEGKKPSFFEDLQFLLIGPLWCVAFLFRKSNFHY